MSGLSAAAVEEAMARQEDERQRRNAEHAAVVRQAVEAQRAEHERWSALPEDERLRLGIIFHLRGGTAMESYEHPEDA